MYLDVRELQQFYAHNNDLGQDVKRRLNARIAEFWPEMTGKILVGYGFALPVLDVFMQHNQVFALMPAQQGAVDWPENACKRTILTQEVRWPFRAGQIDRLIMLNGLEASERPHFLLEECHRTLAEDGEIIFIVPNRSGFWARFDNTPFGFGKPYSGHQLDNLIQSAGFEIRIRKGVLFRLPFLHKMSRQIGFAARFIGERLPLLSPPGLWVVWAKRQVSGVNRPKKLPQRARIIGSFSGAKPQPALNKTAE